MKSLLLKNMDQSDVDGLFFALVHVKLDSLKHYTKVVNQRYDATQTSNWHGWAVFQYDPWYTPSEEEMKEYGPEGCLTPPGAIYSIKVNEFQGVYSFELREHGWDEEVKKPLPKPDGVFKKLIISAPIWGNQGHDEKDDPEWMEVNRIMARAEFKAAIKSDPFFCPDDDYGSLRNYE